MKCHPEDTCEKCGGKPRICRTENPNDAIYIYSGGNAGWKKYQNRVRRKEK